MSQHNTQGGAATQSLAVTYGDRTFDYAALPHATVLAMLKRGTAHYLGNEYNSAVLSREVTAICSNDDPAITKANREKWDAMSTAERKVVLAKFRDERGDEAKAIRDSEMAEFISDMTEGKVGVSVRGPSVDPLQAIVNRLTKSEVSDILKANKIAIPKKSEDKVSLGGTEYTMVQLVGRRLNPELPAGIDDGTYGPKGGVIKDRIEKAARKVIADQVKAADKAKLATTSNL